MADKFGITLKDATTELQALVEEAINFMWSEFEDDWAASERYFAGECDLPTDEGRSNAVKTEVRDVIRALLPNVMRVLYQSRKPVAYLPQNIAHAAFIEQQELYVNQLFTANGGYKILYNAVMQAVKLKSGPIKTWFEDDPAPEYFRYTGLTTEEVEELKSLPDVEVLEVEDHPHLGEKGIKNVSGYKYHLLGKIHIEDFPIYEFFVSRNATSLEDARVHGHHRAITVAEAIEMGLEYDGDWTELMGADPEEKNASEQSRARRGYSVDGSEDDSDDLLQKEILLTEVYCKFDLDGDGIEERYCFYLGGTKYDYIGHYEIEDYCIDLVSVDPVPYTVIGRSVCDIVMPMQDNETSILRAIVDNAHMANNPRFAADPNTTDFADVMNNAVGAPIKTRGAPQIQVVDIPFTGQALIPFLQYLEEDTEQRVGITKAATGLDPDALQSTDKEAVRNTIALSQGQVELMVRNIVETGLIGAFQKMLRLSTRHMDRMQVIRTKGVVLPVDLTTFDPALAAIPNVGLGTASHEQKLATLNFVLGKQEQIVAQFGIDNPFTSLSQIYNTLEDIVDLGGLSDPGRYFKVVSEATEQQLAEKMAEQSAEQQSKMEQQQSQAIDPGTALIQSEQIKAQVKQLDLQSRQQEKMLQAQIDMQTKQMDLDFRRKEQADGHKVNLKKVDVDRDKLVQDRVIALKKIQADKLNKSIQKEQKANDPSREETTERSKPKTSNQQ